MIISKAPIFCFLIFILCSNVQAQKQGQFLADSLEQELSRPGITPREKVNVLTDLTYEYRNLLPSKAIKLGLEAERMAKEIHYEQKLGEIYMHLASSYAFYNDLIKSYEYALTALQYNREYNVTDLIPMSRMMVLSFKPNGDEETTIAEVHDILKDVHTIKDKTWYLRTFGGLGNELKITREYLLADSIISLTISEARKYNLKAIEMHNLGRMQIWLMHRKEYDKALALAYELVAYFESIGEKRLRAEMLANCGEVYEKKYEIHPDKRYLDSALFYAEKGLRISSEIDYKMVMQDNYILLFRVNKRLGNTKEAMDYLEKYVSLRDSLMGLATMRRLEGIAIKQRDEISTAQMKLKDAEVSRQRNYTYTGLAGIGLSGLMLFFVFRNYRNQKKSNAIILHEKQRSEELLLNILPAEMAEELKNNGSTKAKAFTMVTVMFTDFKDFTEVSEKVSAELLVDEIHYCFSAFDRILQNYKIEKIKTIGDAYMCASGLPVSNYTHATDMVNAAKEIRDFMKQRKIEKESRDEIPFDLRIGIHTGPVVAGIVGIKKFAYDIWGDTVNLAARMEQNSEPGKINISGSTYELVKTKFNCTYRGKISAKNKGEIDMYFVS